MELNRRIGVNGEEKRDCLLFPGISVVFSETSLSFFFPSLCFPRRPLRSILLPRKLTAKKEVCAGFTDGCAAAKNRCAASKHCCAAFPNDRAAFRNGREEMRTTEDAEGAEEEASKERKITGDNGDSGEGRKRISSFPRYLHYLL